MEFESVVRGRKSVRNFVEKEISQEDICKIIECANLAPSWKNSQTPRYYVILSKDKISDFAEKCLPTFNRENCKGAGALIVTTFIKNISGFNRDGESQNNLGNGWGCYDLGLATQNLILKAYELSYGSLIMGIRDENLIREFLNISNEEEVVSVIALGGYNDDIKRPERKNIQSIMKII